MNKTAKKTLVALLCLIAILLCSCTPPNTTSTDTKYKYVMIGDISSVDEASLPGAAWRGIKLFQKDTYNAETNDRLETVKYFPLAAFEGSDTVSYADARKAAAVKQLELAASGGASVIVLTGDEYSTAYASVKDTEKTFGDISFVIFTCSGSITSSLANLNKKTLSIVINSAQLGYLYGYAAVKSGYTSAGFVGIEGAYSKSLVAGFAQGASAAAGADGKSVTLDCAYLTAGSDDSTISDKASSLLSSCDVIFGDAVTASKLSAAAIAASKAYIGTGDGAAFDFGFDYTVIENAVCNGIKEAVKLTSVGSVSSLGASDGLYKYTSGTSAFTADEADALIENVKALSSNESTVIKVEIADGETFANVTVTLK